MLYTNNGLSHNECSHLVSSLEEVGKALSRATQSNYLHLVLFQYNQKMNALAETPKTGVEAVITPRRVLSFDPLTS